MVTAQREEWRKQLIGYAPVRDGMEATRKYIELVESLLAQLDEAEVCEGELRAALEALTTFCRVYWGSHGCDRPRGHDGPHQCDSCWDPEDTDGYVGAWPYYGPETNFYGEDAPHARAALAKGKP